MAKKAKKSSAAPAQLFLETPVEGFPTAYLSAQEFADETYSDGVSKVAVYTFDRFVTIKAGVTVEDVK